MGVRQHWRVASGYAGGYCTEVERSRGWSFDMLIKIPALTTEADLDPARGRSPLLFLDHLVVSMVGDTGT